MLRTSGAVFIALRAKCAPKPYALTADRDRKAGFGCVRVLLSDGSGLTSRQVTVQLAAKGHEVHLLSPDPLCLGRFTRHVRRVHRVPSYGRDPFAWLDATLEVLGEGFDALLATHEQVAVLAREVARVRDLGVGLAVPPFAALRRVQDKIAAHATLAELSLPQPTTTIARSIDELLIANSLPIYIKTPIGTASVGVRHVSDRAALELAAYQLGAQHAFADGGLLVQQPAAGPLVMVQAVFADGDLLAWHTNLRARLGSNGGASSKRSVLLPDVREHLAQIGGTLRWHGALSLDAVLTPDGPVYIDVNPRLVEPGNAWHAGVDLVEALLRVTLGDRIDPVAPARPDIVTHQLLNALLGAGQLRGTRRAVLAEIIAAARHHGPYRGSREELTPIHGDLFAAVPVAAAVSALVTAPRLWQSFASNAIASYALTPAGWRAICEPSEGCRP